MLLNLNMLLLKVGDRVYNQNHEGIVVRIDYNLRHPIYVEWDGSCFHYCYYANELGLLIENIIDVDELFEDIEI